MHCNMPFTTQLSPLHIASSLSGAPDFGFTRISLRASGFDVRKRCSLLKFCSSDNTTDDADLKRSTLR